MNDGTHDPLDLGWFEYRWQRRFPIRIGGAVWSESKEKSKFQFLIEKKTSNKSMIRRGFRVGNLYSSGQNGAQLKMQVTLKIESLKTGLKLIWNENNL